MSNQTILLALAGLAAYWVVREKRVADYYGVPAFSEQSRLLQEQDAGF